jgi:hypothetical protein
MRAVGLVIVLQLLACGDRSPPALWPEPPPPTLAAPLGIAVPSTDDAATDGPPERPPVADEGATPSPSDPARPSPSPSDPARQSPNAAVEPPAAEPATPGSGVLGAGSVTPTQRPAEPASAPR